MDPVEINEAARSYRQAFRGVYTLHVGADAATSGNATFAAAHTSPAHVNARKMCVTVEAVT